MIISLKIATRLIWMLPIFTLIALTGCATASLVQTTFQPTKAGVVKYKNSVINGSRSADKANELMADFCAPGTFSLVQQQASSETTGYSIDRNIVTGQATGVSANTKHYVYIQFRCEDVREPASTKQ